MLPFLKEENLSDEEKLQIEEIFWLKVLRAGIHDNQMFSERLGTASKISVLGGGDYGYLKFELI